MGAPIQPGGGGIKSIQHGSVTASGGGNNSTAITTVNTAKAFVLSRGWGNGYDSTGGMPQFSLSASAVSWGNVGGIAESSSTVWFTVVEFN